MRSILLTAVYLFFVVSGFSAAFVFALGYIWVDLFSPQQVSFSIITHLPISMIVGALAIGAYILFDRRDAPRMVFGIWLIGLWAIWITLTTLWAVMPDAAWDKWNWAIKTIVFAAFLPFAIRSRVQIEAMILTIIFSLSGTFIAGGIRTLLTGGGYEINLGLYSGNSGFAEGSTLATACIALIPLILYARKHTLIMTHRPLFDWFCYGLIAAAILTAVGTYERTGLLALGALLGMLWLRSKHKILYGSLALLLAMVGLAMVSGEWYDRMATISTFRTEDSALARIAVWLWTLQYAVAHPLGGGFGVYLIDNFRLPIEGTDDFLTVSGRAFHSIYFEVLGEQGIIGFGIFATIIGTMLFYLRSVQNACRGVTEFVWLYELSTAVMMSSIVYLVGGAFVGIAFQPLLYYWFACAISLHQYVARAQGEVMDRGIVGQNLIAVRPALQRQS